ncbi:MAG: hypothetical protein ABEI86_02695, partial [Halobacteriaceae archaeon]
FSRSEEPGRASVENWIGFWTEIPVSRVLEGLGVQAWGIGLYDGLSSLYCWYILPWACKQRNFDSLL